MQGWLLFHHDLDPALPEVPEVFRFQEAAALAGIDLDVFKPQNFDLIVGASDDWIGKYEGTAVERPDFVLCRTGAETDYATLALLRHLERRGIRLINSPRTIELVADKLHTLQTLSRAGLPVPRTIFARFPLDPDLIERELGFPVIVKTLKGTRGAGVLKCEDRSQFEDLAGLLESAGAEAGFILQHYIRASHGRDVRVLVVGGRVVAAMERRSLTGGFKSNVSLGGLGIAYNPPREMVELVVRAAETLGLDVTGIDILFDEHGYRICEANSAPGFQGLERASGLDVASTILGWIVSTQPSAPSVPATSEGDTVIDLIFGGRTGLREISDRNKSYAGFAKAVGVRLIAGGLSAVAHALLPNGVIDQGGATRASLRALYENAAATPQVRLDEIEQERTLIVTLAVSIWAAALPWLSGAPVEISGVLSFIAMLFPIVFVLTAPSGRARRIALAKRGSDQTP